MQIEKLDSIKSAAADTRGKHRVLAELKRLEQETHHLEEELDQLEKMEAVSAVCKEILSNVETRPDPLLPTTHGPTNPSWDQWFEGPQDEGRARRKIGYLLDF
ncbi:putative G-protein gamma [Helianthus annuus]|uniref:guanine nucleotide-binding protein subunit gamma 2 isoform X2 n=1 Tax=Helianthus annuus TaxID=4232 RepID=UPI0016531FE9|nr:guanine nucleotide-binding protein subunit gamma 2 isoform X2 [Helianthus annuus]KAJ0603250.1 putative G-protein gamma [Helianthus annuus]